MSGSRDRRSFFRHAYERKPPWDIGRPQGALVDAEGEGLVRGDVLDVGCGTGDNSFFLAEKGHRVLGVDLVEAPVLRARAKAQERGLDAAASFETRDILAEPDLGRRIETVIDCGFFHALGDDERQRYAAILACLLDPGGSYLMLCFSDRVPGTFGPRRVSEEEIRATFAGPEWRVREIRRARLESSIALVPWVPAWFAVVDRA